MLFGGLCLPVHARGSCERFDFDYLFTVLFYARNSSEIAARQKRGLTVSRLGCCLIGFIFARARAARESSNRVCLEANPVGNADEPGFGE